MAQTSASVRRLAMFARLALVFVATLAAPAIADACSCAMVRPCQRLGHDVVFAGVVTAEEPVSLGTKGQFAIGGIRYRFTVETPFRGVSGKQVEVIAGGNEAMCGYTFKKGRRYLVYASMVDGRLTTSLCSGTTQLEHAEEDLAYLNGKPTRDAGRVFGRVRFEPRPRSDTSAPGAVANVPIIVRGPGFVRETTTDSGGSFELLGVHGGRISITAAPRPPFMSAEDDVVRETHPLQCPEFDFKVRYDGRVSGVVLDSEKRPARGVIVQALPEGDQYAAIETKANASGAYVIRGLSPGRYAVGVNLDRPATVESPYAPAFLPGTADRQRATLFKLGAGESARVPPLTLPPALNAVEIRGCVVRPNGQPARDTAVEASWTLGDKDRRLSHEMRTDAKGCFTMPAHEGQRYEVVASLLVGRPSGVERLLAKHELTAGKSRRPIRLVLAPQQR